MRILGIETSCDETGAAILNDLEIESNIVSSSLLLHSKTGGIIPEIAAREQIKYIIPVIKRALRSARIENPISAVDAIAVTVGPGLIGSLLVGVETAKTLSLIWKKPLIPVNHLYAHIYANFIGNKTIKFPSLALIVSGGHTDLVLMENPKKVKWLGGTRDDAAGEAFDKIGRLLGLPYPAGPVIESLANQGDTKKFNFPSPLIDSSDYDFSFSGLKTAVLREVESLDTISEETLRNMCASVQKTIINVLIKKTLKAAKEFSVKSILLGGGVAANQTLSKELTSEVDKLKSDISLFVPEKKLCTDNAAMVAAAAFLVNKTRNLQEIEANPSLHY